MRLLAVVAVLLLTVPPSGGADGEVQLVEGRDLAMVERNAFRRGADGWLRCGEGCVLPFRLGNASVPKLFPSEYRTPRVGPDIDGDGVRDVLVTEPTMEAERRSSASAEWISGRTGESLRRFDFQGDSLWPMPLRTVDGGSEVVLTVEGRRLFWVRVLREEHQFDFNDGGWLRTWDQEVFAIDVDSGDLLWKRQGRFVDNGDGTATANGTFVGFPGNYDGSSTGIVETAYMQTFDRDSPGFGDTRLNVSLVVPTTGVSRWTVPVPESKPQCGEIDFRWHVYTPWPTADGWRVAFLAAVEGLNRIEIRSGATAELVQLEDIGTLGIEPHRLLVAQRNGDWILLAQTDCGERDIIALDFHGTHLWKQTGLGSGQRIGLSRRDGNDLFRFFETRPPGEPLYEVAVSVLDGEARWKALAFSDEFRQEGLEIRKVVPGGGDYDGDGVPDIVGYGVAEEWAYEIPPEPFPLLSADRRERSMTLIRSGETGSVIWHDSADGVVRVPFGVADALVGPPRIAFLEYEERSICGSTRIARELRVVALDPATGAQTRWLVDNRTFVRTGPFSESDSVGTWTGDAGATAMVHWFREDYHPLTAVPSHFRYGIHRLDLEAGSILWEIESPNLDLETWEGDPLPSFSCPR